MFIPIHAVHKYLACQVPWGVHPECKFLASHQKGWPDQVLKASSITHVVSQGRNQTLPPVTSNYVFWKHRNVGDGGGAGSVQV